jgi:hypothetical protein
VEAEERVRRRESRVLVLGHATAVVMSLLAVSANTVTLVSGDYKGVVIAAVGWSACATVLMVVLWRRLSLMLKVVSFVLIVANAWTFCDAAWRRLPGVMGW